MQRKVEKDFEIRVTAVGERLFPCKIESQHTDRTRIDWRRYDIPNTPHSTFELPRDISDKLLEMMRIFGIHFVAFDLAVTPDGKFVFFEMNPAPQWVWIEELTGLPITDAIIDELIS